MSGVSVQTNETSLVSFGPDKLERDRMLSAFGERLRSLREAAGVSQQMLAERCFLRHDQVFMLERGKSVPDLSVLLILAEILGVTAGELVDGLAAPSRRGSREQMLALVARGPGVNTETLTSQLGYPGWYVTRVGRYLRSFGEVAWEPPGWWPSDADPANSAPLLTPREAQILAYIRQQQSNAQIALALEIGVETVRTHVAALFRKYGVHRRQDLL
jgi:DNA-binding CsgD family transcriptional regulator/transcriptional regulator with XRE-family HTH domain